jgi:hypothetical protein
MMDEQQLGAIGFLAQNGVLYCSQACARAQGHSEGAEVDQDEYDSLVEDERLAAVTVCPGCGAEFAIDWPERGPD